jgi:hypothetical protein
LLLVPMPRKSPNTRPTDPPKISSADFPPLPPLPQRLGLRIVDAGRWVAPAFERRMSTIQRPAARLLTSEEAASYCSMSLPTFKRLCLVPPLRFSEGKRALLRYDVQSLDEWIDRLSQPGPSSPLSPQEALELRRLHHGRAGSSEGH